jgi:hypothetical protein
MNQFSYKSSNPIFSFILIALVLATLFYLAKGVFWVLTWAAPVLLIITLIIDSKVVLDYLKKLWNQLYTTPFFGIISIALSFFAAPVVIFYLFGKAMLKRKAAQFQRDFQQRYQGFENQYQNQNNLTDDEGFVPYEEIKEESPLLNAQDNFHKKTK